MSLSVGTRLGPYEILSPIGAGGMGVVYKARDTRLDRLVALKFLPPHLSGEPQQRHQLIQEARAASALDHPNIGVVHEIDETPDGQVFIAMAYYEGESLKKGIAAELTFGDAAEIARQIAEGLDHAHRHSVIHRDIKPGNIVITTEGIRRRPPNVFQPEAMRHVAVGPAPERAQRIHSRTALGGFGK